MDRDERAFFTRVYETHFASLFRMVVRIVTDTEIAEDLCHEAFVRFHRHSHRLADEQQALYWLLRVGKNLAFSAQRRVRTERNALDRMPKPSPHMGADEQVLREQTAQQVRDTIGRLPKNLRDVIVLREYGGLSYAEIADTLHISVANAKVRVHRARQRMADALGVEDVHRS